MSDLRPLHVGAKRDLHEMRDVRLHHRLFVIAAAAAVLGCRSAPDVELPVVVPEVPVPQVEIRIARWHGDAGAAASITFDDGTLDHYLLAAPELDRRGLTATFFVITGLMERGTWDDGGTERLLFNWNQARSLVARGHEIGSHSHSHPDLSALDFNRAEAQLLLSLQRLQREISSQQGVTFAWPYWRSNAVGRALASRYYLAARSGAATTPRYLDSGIIDARPHDSLRINALATRPVEDPQLWRQAAQQVVEAGGWAVLSLHGIDNDSIDPAAVGWQPLPLVLYRSILDYLVQRQSQNELWVAPFAAVVKYIERRDATTLRLRNLDAGRALFDIDCPLDPSLFDVPLTVVLQLPPFWQGAVISVDGDSPLKIALAGKVQVELPAHARQLVVALPGE